MCGLAGFFEPSKTLVKEDSIAIGSLMGRQIEHRGPDDFGVWCDVDAGIVLSHRRLSILDLSPAGHQPMVSSSGRYFIAFNGEIYNHLEMRQLLENNSSDQEAPDKSSSQVGGIGIRWRGHSDTETLLAGFDSWGIEATVKKSIGMFAFAVWDNQLRTLTLCRDRIGEKPLYYGWQGGVFLFGSELSALKVHPAFNAGIDRGAICLLLRHNYIPAPYSIYKDISKLEPGSLLSVSSMRPEPMIWKYWDAISVARAGVANPFAGTANDAVDALELLAKDAVRQQMVADVPLGAFLSGGIDSSAIAALMQDQSSRPVKTFTIGFKEAGYNEAVHAKAVARHLGTEHSELYVTPEQSMSVIQRLPSLYCEPFADSSQIPTFLVSQLAKQQVSVSLSGDAGDELFCGYNRYKLAANLWKKIAHIPTPLRKLTGSGITALSPDSWDSLACLIPGGGRFRLLGDKLHKFAGVMSSRTVDELYLGIISGVSNPVDWVIGGFEPDTHLTKRYSDLSGLGPVERMMALDVISYLPDDNLVKVDRAAMGVSLETRVPFLDHRIVEFAWSLPLNYKLRDAQTKWPLRQVLYRHVPRELIDRPKMGFSIPLHDWLRGPLREWAESLLDEDRLSREGFFYPAPIRKMWAEHLKGRRNWMAGLWSILMFQAWLEENQG